MSFRAWLRAVGGRGNGDRSMLLQPRPPRETALPEGGSSRPARDSEKMTYQEVAGPYASDCVFDRRRDVSILFDLNCRCMA
jgi:hypothetical protein